jgi:hypothetical protein
MKHFKSKLTGRVIPLLDQCFYCKQLKTCELSMTVHPPYKCPYFDEDPEVRVAGSETNQDKKNNMIDKFKHIEKTKSEIAIDETMNDIINKLWIQSDYATAFYLGVVTNLKQLAKIFKEPCEITREDYLKIMSIYKKDNNVPDKIKDLIDTIFEEFNYKES